MVLGRLYNLSISVFSHILFDCVAFGFPLNLFLLYALWLRLVFLEVDAFLSFSTYPVPYFTNLDGFRLFNYLQNEIIWYNLLS